MGYKFYNNKKYTRKYFVANRADFKVLTNQTEYK